MPALQLDVYKNKSIGESKTIFTTYAPKKQITGFYINTKENG